jgi:N-acetylmuramoyl-L-alanine amidase
VKDRFTVVIDPGHGGIDSGAIGATGVTEKDLTLAVALQLHDAILAEGTFDVKLTRREDVFVALNDRIAFSRNNHADLTIAIHADTVRQKFVRGATVYTLSRTASDELSEELARSENLSDVVAGLEFDPGDDAVGDILADLTARETAIFSHQFAGAVIAQLEGKVALIKNPKRSAAFRVLKTAEVPAILLELGYLSNPEDEKHMTDPVWQAMIAKEVAAATRAFFQGREPN